MGPILPQVPSALRWSVRTVMAAVVARKTQRVIAVSPYIEHHFRHSLHYRGDITVVPNMMSPASLALPVRVGPRATEGTRFITILSSWSARKNGTAAIEAFAEVRAQIPGVSLHMIGQGLGPGGPGERWASEHHIAEGITFVGPQPHDRVLEYLTTADILVHPALEESAGMVLVEAQTRRGGSNRGRAQRGCTVDPRLWPSRPASRRAENTNSCRGDEGACN